jgi:DHA2 family multidrug resistance protein
MTGYSIEMDQWPIIVSGTVQGLGLGCIFVPLSALTFATLAPKFRTEAAGIYSLVRNLGSSVGISVVESFLARNIQVNHASLAAHVTPYNHAMHMPQVAQMWNMHTTTGLMTLNEEVTRQASMIAYLDDFKLMMIVTLAAIPLLLMVRKPGQHKASAAAALD